MVLVVDATSIGLPVQVGFVNWTVMSLWRVEISVNGVGENPVDNVLRRELRTGVSSRSMRMTPKPLPSSKKRPAKIPQI